MTESTGTGGGGGGGGLDDVKTHHTHTFSSTKLLTRVTVADKIVLMKIPFVHCLMRCLFAVSSCFVRRASLTVNIDLSEVTNKYYTVLYRTVVVYEKKNR